MGGWFAPRTKGPGAAPLHRQARNRLARGDRRPAARHGVGAAGGLERGLAHQVVDDDGAVTDCRDLVGSETGRDEGEWADAKD